MSNNILNLNQNFINMKDLCLLFHKQAKFSSDLARYISENALYETASFLLPNGQKKQIPIFHYGMKEGKEYGLYLYQKTLPHFLKKHQENLINLGIERERIYALLHIIPSLTPSEKIQNRDNLLLLGKISNKLTNNPRVACLLTQYIKDHLLTATYTLTDEQTQQKIQKNMFCFSPSHRGRSAVYLIKEALPFFLERYQNLLKEKAIEMEQENEVLSLRGFALLLGKNNHEKELFQFIQEHLDEKVIIQNKRGENETVQLFDVKKHGSGYYVNIQKKGLPSFIKKYKTELVNMGFLMADVIAEEFDKNNFAKNFKLLKFFIKKLTHSKAAQSQIYSYFNQIYQSQKESTSSLITYRNQLFIHKDQAPLFFKKHKKELLKQGADPLKLEHLTGEQVLLTKTPDMLTFREFATRLKADFYKFKQIEALLKKYVSTETYIPSKSPLKKREKSFIWCQSTRSLLCVLKNEEAFSSFLKNHKQELVDIGLKKEMIEQISGEKEYPLICDEFIYLNQLKEMLHIDNKDFYDYVRANSLHQTYIDTDKKSEKKEKPMFLFMRGKRLGFGDYALDKKALKAFVLNHAQPLKIKPAVQEAVFFGKPILQKKETHITLPALAEFLGISTKRAPILVKAIKEHFIHETALISSENKNAHQPVFSYAYTPSGQMTLYADIDCLMPFLEKRKKDLIALGFKEEKIEALQSRMQQDPCFIQRKERAQKLKKLLYIKTHPTNRQREN